MSEHPDIDKLTEYLLEPDNAGDKPLRQHLASCQACRTTVERLAGMHQSLQRQPFSSLADSSPLTETDDMQIAAMLDGALTSAQEKELRLKIDKSPAMLKSALHYASHSAAMQRDNIVAESLTETFVKTMDATRTKAIHERNPAPGLFSRFMHWLDQQTAALISVPVTAAIVFALAITFLPDAQNTPSPFTIAAYQDDPVITFKPDSAARPGIGFFNTFGSSDIRPFVSMQISLSDSDILNMSWPKIATALEYNINISSVNNEGTTVLYSASTKQPGARFEGFRAQPGKRYEWVISGHTSEHSTFKTSGGFVIP